MHLTLLSSPFLAITTRRRWAIVASKLAGPERALHVCKVRVASESVDTKELAGESKSEIDQICKQK